MMDLTLDKFSDDRITAWMRDKGAPIFGMSPSWAPTCTHCFGLRLVQMRHRSGSMSRRWYQCLDCGRAFSPIVLSDSHKVGALSSCIDLLCRGSRIRDAVAAANRKHDSSYDPDAMIGLARHYLPLASAMHNDVMYSLTYGGEWNVHRAPVDLPDRRVWMAWIEDTKTEAVVGYHLSAALPPLADLRPLLRGTRWITGIPRVIRTDDAAYDPIIKRLGWDARHDIVGPRKGTSGVVRTEYRLHKNGFKRALDEIGPALASAQGAASTSMRCMLEYAVFHYNLVRLSGGSGPPAATAGFPFPMVTLEDLLSNRDVFDKAVLLELGAYCRHLRIGRTLREIAVKPLGDLSRAALTHINTILKRHLFEHDPSRSRWIKHDPVLSPRPRRKRGLPGIPEMTCQVCYKCGLSATSVQEVDAHFGFLWRPYGMMPQPNCTSCRGPVETVQHRLPDGVIPGRPCGRAGSH